MTRGRCNLFKWDHQGRLRALTMASPRNDFSKLRFGLIYTSEKMANTIVAMHYREYTECTFSSSSSHSSIRTKTSL